MSFSRSQLNDNLMAGYRNALVVVAVPDALQPTMKGARRQRRWCESVRHALNPRLDDVTKYKIIKVN